MLNEINDEKKKKYFIIWKWSHEFSGKIDMICVQGLNKKDWILG
jgi:hypothetical protein